MALKDILLNLPEVAKPLEKKLSFMRISSVNYIKRVGKRNCGCQRKIGGSIIVIRV